MINQLRWMSRYRCIKCAETTHAVTLPVVLPSTWPSFSGYAPLPDFPPPPRPVGQRPRVSHPRHPSSASARRLTATARLTERRSIDSVSGRQNMTPPCRVFPASQLPTEIQMNDGKRRKGGKIDLSACELLSMVQYDCLIDRPDLNDSRVKCWPVQRWFRRYVCCLVRWTDSFACCRRTWPG